MPGRAIVPGHTWATGLSGWAIDRAWVLPGLLTHGSNRARPGQLVPISTSAHERYMFVAESMYIFFSYSIQYGSTLDL